MLELFLSFASVAFIPKLVTNLILSNDSGLITGYIVNFLLMLVVSIIINIIHAWRYCEEDSYGISYGFFKGLMSSGIATAGSILVQYVPILKAPFFIISMIPYLDTMVDGAVLSTFYMLGYLFAYTIFGSC